MAYTPISIPASFVLAPCLSIQAIPEFSAASYHTGTIYIVSSRSLRWNLCE